MRLEVVVFRGEEIGCIFFLSPTYVLYIVIPFRLRLKSNPGPFPVTS